VLVVLKSVLAPRDARIHELKAKPGINDRRWRSSAVYAKGDVVTHCDSAWTCGGFYRRCVDERAHGMVAPSFKKDLLRTA
jgi:hypothetical protein